MDIPILPGAQISQAGYQAGNQVGCDAGSRAGFQSPAGFHADFEQ